MRRSRALTAIAIAALTATGAAACSSASSSSSSSTSPSSSASASGSSSSAPTASITAWIVTTASAGQPSPSDAAEKALATAFDNAHPGDTVNIQLVNNDTYKTQIANAMTAGNEPQIFWTWGGGTLDQDIAAGKVVPLATTSQVSSGSSYLSQFLPSSLGAVTDNGNVYGIPIQGTQPVYFFYNKKVFSQYGLSFPKTWAQLLSDATVFKSHGIAPISLAGGSTWPDLMYLEYLTDRIGGPSVATAIQKNEPNAWSNPAVTEALTDIQTLVKDGDFQTGYTTLQDNGTNDTLVYTGKAAMQLMGDWDISSILGEDASFISSGELGMGNFPTVAGGTGNPADLAGNTASYVAISTNTTAAQKAVAEEFFQQELASPAYAKAQVAAGEVPVTSGSSADFSGNLASFDTQIYNDVQNAPSFQYSWDQATTPGVSAELITDLGKLFDLSITPAAMESDLNSFAAKDAASS
jgi:raffinose/stachyose/melibiose transport system substrate-binding protein